MAKRVYSPDEREQALELLEELGGNLSAAAAQSGVPRKTLADWRDGAGAGDEQDEAETLVSVMAKGVGTLANPSMVSDSPPPGVEVIDGPGASTFVNIPADPPPPGVVDVSGFIPLGYDGDGAPVFRLDAIPLVNDGVQASYVYDGRCLVTIRASQRAGANIARQGQERARDMIHETLTQSLSATPELREYQHARAQAANLRQQLATLEQEIATAATALGSRASTDNVEDQQTLLALFKDEILQRRRREREQVLADAVAVAERVATAARDKALAVARTLYAASRGDVMGRLLAAREQGMRAVEAALAEVLPEVALTLSAIRHFPDGKPGDLGGILDALPAAEGGA